MSGNGLINQIEKFDDIDEVSDLEDLEDEDIVEPEPINTTDRRCVNWTDINNLSLIPLLLFDQELKVRWRNKAYQTFRESVHVAFDYQKETFDSFFSSFSGDSTEANIRRTGLLTALESPENRYSWQGMVDGIGADSRRFKMRLSITPETVNEDGKPILFRATCDNVTVVIEHLVQSNFEGILRASLFRDEDTGNHIKRLNAYSRFLAEHLLSRKKDDPSKWPGLDLVFVEDIGQLAAFHDVGKIGTPDRILLKPGKLTDDEWMTMKEHPLTGALILTSHPNPMIRDIARSHHERWDGTGYPSSIDARYPAPLTGEQIPLSGRIVALADVYDALRTRRFYKEPFNEEKAAKIIMDGRGSHFDPEIVDVFIGLRKEFDRISQELSD